MTSLLLYFVAIARDGDWANDWLTHLPTLMQPLVLIVGKTLAFLLEGK